ncbi:MAG: GTPase HflX [Alphaproteobacteria bacterium]|nr:GTPase HflX [Alphaproteobacteria bacterium]
MATSATSLRSGAIVVHPVLKRTKEERLRVTRSPESRLHEATGLATAIDLEIRATETVPVSRIRPATFVGQGSVEHLGALVTQHEADLVVMDCPLSPIQQRNLERAWRCKVIDRTALILEIFGARAHTREGILQVELAHLSYQRSRLVRSWTHLERQRGGFGFLGGPGETQIETDRRLIGERIARIRRELEEVKRTRELHRVARRRIPYPIVALVGYTNAGKSTLFNRLTNAEVMAADQLFATLDPTMRGLALPSGRSVILSDTVGFISELPHELVAAFRATLEEVLTADIVIHVRDAAHPDSLSQKTDVEAVLRDLGLGAAVDAELIQALNKIDLLDPVSREETVNQAQRQPHLVPVSALTGQGTADLLRLIDERLARGRELIETKVPLHDGAAMAWLYRRGEVIARHDDDTHAHITVRLDPDDAGRLRDSSN